MKKKEAGGGKSEELIAFLKTKRWFGDKARSIRGASLRDVVPVAWPGSKKQFAVVRADIATDAGSSTYQLFAPRAVNGEAQTGVDALEDDEFRRGFADAWVMGADFVSRGTRWIIQRETKTPLVVPPNAPITLSTAEQTNSSVIMNRQAILKLYRRMEPGAHPDVEITRFLTIERQFVHVPVLLGTVRFEDRDGVTIAGMLQEYVQGATDGWAYALESVRSASRAGAKARQPTFEQDACHLGEVTRALHEHLASGDRGGDFDLRSATPGDVERWVEGARKTVGAGLSAIERARAGKTVRGDDAEQAGDIVSRGPMMLDRITRLGDALSADAGGNTRTHGDLHLGQVLRSAAGRFLIIDFEGEPTRPLRERRERHSPLRDVAGMLRSFSYAAAAGASGGRGTSKGKHGPRSRWETDTRAAFLKGYFSEAKGRPGLLPQARSNADDLITLFEVEKAFYELQYELDHRPDWVWIPIRAISALLP